MSLFNWMLPRNYQLFTAPLENGKTLHAHTWGDLVDQLNNYLIPPIRLCPHCGQDPDRPPPLRLHGADWLKKGSLWVPPLLTRASHLTADAVIPTFSIGMDLDMPTTVPPTSVGRTSWPMK